LTVLAACAVATLVVGGAPARAEAPDDPAVTAPTAVEPAVTLGSMNVAIDPQTGQLRPLTPAEQKRLVAEMKKLFSVKAHDPVLHADGMISTVLGTEYLSFSVARLTADGSIERECAASQESALAFLAGETAASPAAPPLLATTAVREER
jgi:hypothetical protein